LIVNPAENAIQTLHEALRRYLRGNYGMLLLTFTRSGGFDWDKSRIEDDRDRNNIEKVLQTHKLLQIAQDEHETAKVIRGVTSLLRKPRADSNGAMALTCASPYSLNSPSMSPPAVCLTERKQTTK